MRVLAPEEGELALRIARGALDAHLAGMAYRLPPVPGVFSEKRGVFVTLTERGLLRGCIGLPLPVLPLGDALVEAAVSAGTGDPRFPPVCREEMREIHVEVTVLSVPEPLTCQPAERPRHVEVGRHGLIMRGEGEERPAPPAGGHRVRVDCRRVPGAHLREVGAPPRVLEVP